MHFEILATPRVWRLGWFFSWHPRCHTLWVRSFYFTLQSRGHYMCHGRSTPYIGDKLIPPSIGILTIGIGKLLLLGWWPSPIVKKTMGVCSTLGTYDTPTQTSCTTWGFPKMVLPCATPKSSILKKVFHYKPSILGYHHFRKPPFLSENPSNFTIHFRIKLSYYFWAKILIYHTFY